MAFAVRRRQSEVLTLDKPTIVDLRIDLPPAHSKAITQIVKSWLVMLGEDQIDMVSTVQKARMVGLQAVTNPEGFTDTKVLWDDVPFETLEEIIKQIGTVGSGQADGKLVIFCNFRATVIKLADKLKAYNPALVYGGSKAAEESHRFKTDPFCRVMVANYQSGGSGHNWQGVASSMVFYEPIADVKAINQSLGRISRSGQTKPVVVWIFNYRVAAVNTKWDKAKERAVLLEEALGDTLNFTDFIGEVNLT
jgi:SNF2 family DNA or RNA helicase